MRSITQATIASLNSIEGAFALPVFLEISHADLATPLRVVNNEVDLVYDGNTYAAIKFRYTPPNLREDGTVSNATIVISAIDQSITEALRSLSSPATIKAVAVYWPDTGTTEAVASWSMKLRNATGQAEYIQAELEFENRLRNQIPGRVVRPATYPGAFA